MALNPLAFTENVVRNFLRYQMTTYPLEDQRLNSQLRNLLSMDETRNTPLLKGPYVSLSRSFAQGAKVEDLIAEDVLHPFMANLIPYSNVYGHQEQAIRSICGGKTTLVSTGTGSGKSECFLYPIISKCLQLKDADAEPGISAVIVYPMNALAEDQMDRLRDLLAGTGVTFGLYVGNTARDPSGVIGERLPPHASGADFRERKERMRSEGSAETLRPPEEVCDRQTMRTPGKQPRILITNVNQLELLLTRQLDIGMFDGATLDYFVFDEAHTFSGASGAEASCLIRRLRSYCGKDPLQTTCVATSATIVDERNPDAALDFASRFFGVPAEEVETVNETYQRDDWKENPSLPAAPADKIAFLDAFRKAVDEQDQDRAVRAAWASQTGGELSEGDLEEVLHDELSGNLILVEVSTYLESPKALPNLIEALSEKVGREVSQEELLGWLTLGALARKDDRPLVRPVVHLFLRGVSGAVVTFDESSQPILHLAAEDDEEDEDEEHRKLRMPLMTCSTCGQHYLEHHLSDFTYLEPTREAGGGTACSEGRYWESMDKSNGGNRVVFVDSLISEGEEEEEESLPNNRTQLYLCRHCGCAHDHSFSRCESCGSEGGEVKLWAIRQRDTSVGRLRRCLCCGSTGREYGGRLREPAKPVRATNVADVHVLSQNVVHHAERQRLLVFADNRQEASFQAGWMKDHARRFRLRSIIAETLRGTNGLSVGDLVYRLDQRFDGDDGLSEALLPEVWKTARKGDAEHRHREERLVFVRIAVLREITTSKKERTGLEPWGRLKVIYNGLEESSVFIQEWSNRLGLPSDELMGGIAALLDGTRRGSVLRDQELNLFGKIWEDSDPLISKGYIPKIAGIPKGVKLRRNPADDKRRISQWISDGRMTVPKQVAQKWGVEEDDLVNFVEDLWHYLVEIELLVPVRLVGSRGNPLPNCSGTHQINGDNILLQGSSSGAYRCKTCRRTTSRRTPKMLCMAWHCNGEIEHIPESPDNYDLHLVDREFTMLRPEEHTAMVPHNLRTKYENQFKGDSDKINTLVCTQTLEMGVDIGALDSVVMRNVPPMPSNYWQRAGRAGRRHRMAVVFTYCRNAGHDRSYFSEPLKMLEGKVDPPSFNMSNDLMLEKHAHATILTRLRQMASDASTLSEGERERIKSVLEEAFPNTVTPYLFDGKRVRTEPFDFSEFGNLVTDYFDNLKDFVSGAFSSQGWPEGDRRVIEEENINRIVRNIAESLTETVMRLHRRLRWSMDKMGELDEVRREEGSLEDDQNAFYRRCERFVARMKGRSQRARREAEGFDDIVTYGVLAAEGFLPGHGLNTGTILGMAEVPYNVSGLSDFDLPRPPTVALREYVPGNLIYANGQKFTPRHYSLSAEEGNEQIELALIPERGAVAEVTGTVASASDNIIKSIPISDVNLIHRSRVSDDEPSRFLLPVTIYGRELGQHSGGDNYSWGSRSLMLLKGLRLQLVNVGPTSMVDAGRGFGYPVCGVCGQSVSPFASDAQKTDFIEKHEQWCNKRPEPLSFHADFASDSLKIPGCESKRDAFSLSEALRFGAAGLLDMELEDLQIAVIGNPDAEDYSAILYDPMPGGSGLLDQLCKRFDEVLTKALEIARNCPAVCETSCIDCFQNYRNGFYHDELNRHLIIETIEELGNTLSYNHSMPAIMPAAEPTGLNQPTNEAEAKLRQLILDSGLPDGLWNETFPLNLPAPHSSTRPDVTYDDPDDSAKKIFVYLDGLSEHIHGNPQNQEKDRVIRTQLLSDGHQVVPITAHDLDDPEAMNRHFRRLSRMIGA